MKWNYRVTFLEGRCNLDIETELAKLGFEGWELVALKGNQAFLKRPVTDLKADSSAKGSKKDVNAFVAELIEVCRRHDFSLGHEDVHGNFTVEKPSEENINWLARATDCVNKKG